MTTKALVILSGGQDSTICLYLAKQQFDQVHAVTFDYGQRHYIEIECAKNIAKIAKIDTHEVIDVSKLLSSCSPLNNDSVELEKYNDYNHMEEVIGDRVEHTFVPMRNSLFLTVAANRAVTLGCNDMFIGVSQDDNANYPDCTAEFISAQNHAINKSLGIKGFKIHAPLLYVQKSKSIQFAQELGAMNALAYSHTCYAGQYPPCGECHSCLLRENAFAKAGVVDPLIERANNVSQ